MRLHIKKCLILFFLLVFQSNSFGQDFKWVYDIVGRLTEASPVSQINDIITDNQDNIYVTGVSTHRNDFSNGSGNIVFDYETALVFIIKLSKNKNVLWVKHFNVHSNVVLHVEKLHIDSNQNLFLTGFLYHSGASFIDLNPDPGEQHTIENPSHLYGMIIKLNPSGNYINSWHFEDCNINNLDFDSNQNVIAVGRLITHDILSGIPAVYTGTIFKFDSNFNTIWTKTLDGYSTDLYKVVVDNYDDLILTGHYYKSLNFAGESFQEDAGLITCKFDKDGNEKWILERAWNESTPGGNLPPNENLAIDSNNTLYISSNYNDASQFNFNNTTIANLPYQGSAGAVMLGFDTDGNYVSHFTFSGTFLQNFSSFAISEFDEFIIGTITAGDVFFRNSNGFVTSFNAEKENILIKINSSYELIDYKKMDHLVRNLSFDSENNIIMGHQIHNDTDFDPHPINVYNVSSIGLHTGYVLKLSYCDSYPPTGENTNTFCSDDNATIADLEINDYSVNWYASNNSIVPLDSTTLLVDGQTYYAAKDKLDNCPDILERITVSVIINPVPPAPILNPNQPCYNSSLTLADLSIEGVNLSFYDNATTSIKLNDLTLINPEKTYYVSQTLSGCESPRTPINIPGQSTVQINNHMINLCDTDKNNVEQINLSNYISYLLNGNENDFTISYHNTQVDAENGSNPIQNFEEYQANTQNVYVRFLYNSYSCFEIATLIITISSPPEITEIIVRDLSSNNSITVLPNNPEHLYSIDGINYQSSNVFQNVLAGEYTVYVKDKLEVCNEEKEKVYLLSYPKFFTPNGDGYNDFWKIEYAKFQFSVDVEIYDRFGKLLASFDKNSPGWDGTYNGYKLPATDYWFKITRFLDKKVIHKGHFSLKR
ncbi:T9SS type B sorting domain-containing protein [Flavobacterium soli]|uniref:T9SS type B sorting domain-containing protein n=1 Tax=Flavobacterium soli TaxID=344881 RepID=UPI00041C70DC|nr:T9SS type B sorting domain-containing protein [Flavobacterium soli]